MEDYREFSNFTYKETNIVVVDNEDCRDFTRNVLVYRDRKIDSSKYGKLPITEKCETEGIGSLVVPFGLVNKKRKNFGLTNKRRKQLR